MEGFIQLHRKMMEWEWYDDINTKVLFIHILIKCNWSDKSWRGIMIERGTFITSLQTLADETQLSLQQVRTSLKKLISTHEITKESHSSFTLIKVNNYNDHQSNNTPVNKPVTNEQQTDNKRVTTTNNTNNINKNNNIYSEVGIIATKVTTLQTIIKDNFSLEFITEVYNKYNMSKSEFKEECELFEGYWNAILLKGKDKGKPRWEGEKTFDSKLRFRTWIKNNDKWSNRVIVNSEDEERKQKLAELKRKKDLLFNG